MAKEQDSVVDFLNEISDKPDIFAEKEPEKEEKQEESVEVKDEGEKSLPFHKDPKVQRYVEKQIEKALKDIKPSQESSFRKEVEDINLPQSFVELIGNDTPEKQKVLKDMAEYLSSLPQKAKEEFLKEQEERTRQAREAEIKAQEELDTYFDEIEEAYKVDLSSNSAAAKQLRSQFIEYVRKIAPKNEDGEVTMFPDLLASFEVFQALNKTAPASRAKELANRGLARSGDTDTSIPQGRSWKDVDRFFDTLKTNT